MTRRGLPAFICLGSLLFLTACAEPPNKEMDRAQGAIDAARAAGAEQYATTEYSAATTALKSATDAVAAGDYRLALNSALVSHEHAENAARDTANTKARMRGDLERSLAELDALLARATARIQAAERSRIARDRLAEPAGELTAATTDVQKAREAVTAGEYLAATEAVGGIKERIETAIAAIEDAVAPPARRRR